MENLTNLKNLWNNLTHSNTTNNNTQNQYFDNIYNNLTNSSQFDKAINTYISKKIENLEQMLIYSIFLFIFLILSCLVYKHISNTNIISSLSFFQYLKQNNHQIERLDTEISSLNQNNQEKTTYSDKKIEIPTLTYISNNNQFNENILKEHSPISINKNNNHKQNKTDFSFN